MANIFGGILDRYPIVNVDWDIGDSVYGLDLYMTKVANGVEMENYGVNNYVGIREYFVRNSEQDDNFGSGSSYNNVDPWNRGFKAYKRGHSMNIVNQYVCRPMVNRDNGNIMMYVITTSVEGRMIYCLDVIGV